MRITAIKVLNFENAEMGSRRAKAKGRARARSAEDGVVVSSKQGKKEKKNFKVKRQ
jgi:hypothetical protein